MPTEQRTPGATARPADLGRALDFATTLDLAAAFRQVGADQLRRIAEFAEHERIERQMRARDIRRVSIVRAAA